MVLYKQKSIQKIHTLSSIAKLISEDREVYAIYLSDSLDLPKWRFKLQNKQPP